MTASSCLSNVHSSVLKSRSQHQTGVKKKLLRIQKVLVSICTQEISHFASHFHVRFFLSPPKALKREDFFFPKVIIVHHHLYIRLYITYATEKRR